MAFQGINTGTSPNDGTGDSLLEGAVKINSNFQELYSAVNSLGGASSGISSSIIDFGGDPSGIVGSSKAFSDAFTYLKPLGGGTLRIPSGTFIIDEQIDPDGVDNITIRGEGSSSIIKFANNFTQDRWLYNLTDGVTHNNWTLSDFCFDGNDTQMGTKECTRDKVVKMRGNNFTCKNLLVRNEAGRGFITWLGDNQVYSDCIFKNIGTLAKDSSSLHPGNANEPASNVVIEGCVSECPAPVEDPDPEKRFGRISFIDAVCKEGLTITGNSSIGGNAGILISWNDKSNCDNVTVTGNTIKTGRGYALHVYSPAGTGKTKMRNVTVSNNVLIGDAASTFNGRYVSDDEENNPTGQNKYIENLTYVGNICQNIFESIADPDRTPDAVNLLNVYNAILSSNVFLNIGGRGIDLDRCEGVVFSNNTVVEAPNIGVDFVECVDLTITGNTIKDGDHHGLRLSQCDNANISGNLIVNNGASLGSGHAGILVGSNNTNFAIFNNSCIDDQSNPTQSYGIRCSTATGINKLIIRNNYVNGNRISLVETNPTQIDTSAIGANLGLERLFNAGADDARSVEPGSPYNGMIYLDDGSNTGTGNPGLRYYNGTSWTNL